jgi:hypothetical protein
MPHELRGVAPGVWIWRVDHPNWRPGLGWNPPVTDLFVRRYDARAFGPRVFFARDVELLPWEGE